MNPLDAGLILLAFTGLALGALARRDRIRLLADLADRLDADAATPEAVLRAAHLAATRARGAAARAAARDAEADALAAALPVGCVRLAPDGTVAAANRAAETILGAAAGRLAGRTVMEAFLDPAAEALVRGAREGRRPSAELRVGAPEPRPVVATAAGLPDGGAWLVLEDVAELRRLAAIRTAFVDNLGHELRTPLASISLLAELLAAELEGEAVTPRMRERVARIQSETGHLAQMAGELLDLARIEGGGALALREGVDLARVAADGLERLRPYADREGIGLALEVAPGLPAVRGDDERLGQVVLNLVHNAITFSPSGATVTVRVAPADGGEAVVAVEDRGPGVPRAEQARIFERFYKVDRARTRGRGTGLGLSIARHIVAQHGGRIWVTSVEGEGSTFAFALPGAGAATAGPGARPVVPGERAAADGAAEAREG